MCSLTLVSQLGPDRLEELRALLIKLGLDDFENIPKEYEMQSKHSVPGGLKSIMVTEYGKKLNQPL